MLGWDHVPLRVLDQFGGPTRVFEQMCNRPTVLDWDTHVTLPVHPEEMLPLEFLQPKPEFHGPNEPCSKRDDADDAVREREVQHLLRHRSAHAESSNHQRPCRSVSGNLLLQLRQ